MRLVAAACVALVSSLIGLAGAGTALAAGGPASERVWVVYETGAKGPVQAALHAANADVHFQFDDLNAFAATLPARAINGLQNNPNVEYIEEDPLREPYSALPGEAPPYGINMVQAPAMQARG